MAAPPDEQVELEQKLAMPEAKPIPSEEQLMREGGAAAGGEDHAIPRWRFWTIFASLCMVMFLTALDSTVITIALPTISRSLRSTQYTWIVNGYALACSVFLLVIGQLADIFDRKPIVLACVFLFGGGSAICGAAQTVGMMIAGRVVQGVGGGGIAVLAEVLCSDMVTIGERPKYLGLLLALAALGTVVGPSVGGGIVAHTTWRWIFYINLPLSGFSFAAFALFDAATPPAAVTALFNFMRGLGAVWGATVPSVVFNARVAAGLRRGAVADAGLRARLADGGAFALASAEFVGSLDEGARAEVVGLYTASLRVVWYVAMAISLAAFLLACTEKRIRIAAGER